MLNTACFPASPCRMTLWSWSPHTGSQLQLLSGALGWGCRKCWVTSPPPKPRSLLKVRPGAAILDRKHANNLLLYFLGSELTTREPGALCVLGKVKSIILALWRCRCFIHGHHPVYTRWQHGRWTSTSLLEVIRPLGPDSPIFLDWVVWMLGQSQWDSYWSRVGMENSFSREFSTNKTSWQSLLTSIMNCYSLDHGKSCIVGHIWRCSGRVKGKSIGSLKGKQSYIGGERSLIMIWTIWQLIWASYFPILLFPKPRGKESSKSAYILVPWKMSFSLLVQLLILLVWLYLLSLHW